MTQVHMSLRDLSQLVVLQIQRGKSRDEVAQVLVARGWPEVSAVRFVDMTLFEQGKRSSRARTSTEGQSPAHRTSPRGRWSWPLLVVVLIAVGLLGLVMASVWLVYVR